LLLNRNNYIDNDFFVFCKFPLPSTLFLPPALASPGIAKQFISVEAYKMEPEDITNLLYDGGHRKV